MNHEDLEAIGADIADVGNKLDGLNARLEIIISLLGIISVALPDDSNRRKVIDILEKVYVDGTPLEKGCLAPIAEVYKFPREPYTVVI